jgi:hypothetical protein
MSNNLNYGVYAPYVSLKSRLILPSEVPYQGQDDATLIEICIEASRLIDQECKRPFYPRQELRYYDQPWEDSCVLDLDDDLLEVGSVYTDNGNTEITNYFLKTGPSYNHYPKTQIAINQSGTIIPFGFDDTPQQSQQVTGVWGYNTSYDVAWRNVSAVVDAPLAVGTESVEVADATLFLAQQLIRFGTGATAEYAYITSLDTASNKLNIDRGVNGSIAVEQAAATVIYVYEPMSDLVSATHELAIYLYRRMASAGNDDDVQVVSQSGALIVPSFWPGNVKNFIKRYRRARTSMTWQMR